MRTGCSACGIDSKIINECWLAHLLTINHCRYNRLRVYLIYNFLFSLLVYIFILRVLSFLITLLQNWKSDVFIYCITILAPFEILKIFVMVLVLMYLIWKTIEILYWRHIIYGQKFLFFILIILHLRQR